MKQIHYIASLVIKRVELEDTREPSGRYTTSPGPQNRKVGDNNG
jgi:hypothetical protein